ncbi:hypothetical protein B7P43_G00603 [Cryptotermes secundus]|uniref:Uncharacterized protein n=1 Tax=Cryptotermes secundus TaxID=105785 RepID=A0A2J7Q6C8_9NEOP|nr:uncharacterized protein LOC111869512 [Cryptotermes secundus]PNF24137.1 hypothetical protein B7P43_G00603 [Cryptotermes secundus]
MQKEANEIQPSLRLCYVSRPSAGYCGFHLTRTAWDPYPWVSKVESGSAAEAAGLQAGDCVLEVNGEDVLGQRVREVASRVRAKADRVTLLLWNAGSDPHTAASYISGNGTTPVSLQRLSSCLQSALQLLECPVCLETVPPPAFQCCNGHVLCGSCRTRAEKCPVCRVSLGPRGRCLLADKLHSLLTTMLNQSKEKCAANTKQPQKHPALYLKSRIATDCVHGIDDEQSNPTAATSNGNPSTQDLPDTSCEHAQPKENISPHGRGNAASQSTANDGNSKLNISRVVVKTKASSEENITLCTQQLPDRRISHQISSSYIQKTTPFPLRTRSFSAGQIPVGSESLLGKTFCAEANGLLFHCPFPTKPEPYCCSIVNGPRPLLQHLREVHQGPFVEYFLQLSSSGVTVRLPLSCSKPVAESSLKSFTAHGDLVFFVEVATAATTGRRLIWLWLMGDAVQAERYRLRLTLPEGDTHTGPVFPLTASWGDVVNSNCCVSIEERRYIHGNPEVQLEILDVGSARTKQDSMEDTSTLANSISDPCSSY